MLALGSGVYAWRTFPASYPLLDLEVRMSRGQAVEASDSLATRLRLGPDGARRVAVFQGDPEAQTFIELEGGGPDAFRALVQSGEHPGWHWQVRRFRAGEPHEVSLYFDPDGRPAGFRERLPETVPGPILDTDSARVLALEVAAAEWGVQVGSGWIERPAAVEARASGRRDHTFIWERTHAALGEGRFQLRMVVSGDRLTELTHRIHVPEAFERRYREIRSANEGLAYAASVVMLVLYGLGGIIGGLVVLARKQQLATRAAVGWAALLAAIVTASLINYLPLAWIDYDTAIAVEMFLFQQLGLVVASLLGLTLMFGASFLGGENLTRAGFPRHPFLWGVLRRDTGGSTGLIRRVALGLLLTPVFLAYMVSFGVLTRDWTGWWNPITPLTDPNLIATPLPWLQVVAGPLQAAVWEELLFRAVPFGAAVLLSRRFGGRTAWIAVAFLLQTVVFAAAHANYPAQPSYARLVELLLPSVLFGFLFLRWGLVPAIVLHFEYDLVLFALPLFATPGTTLLGSKVIVVLAGLAPLGIVMVRAIQAGALRPLPEASRNLAHLGERAAHPLTAPLPQEAARRMAEGSPPSSRALAAVVAIGLMAFGLVTVSRPRPEHRIEISRSQAVSAARDSLARQGVAPGEGTFVARTTPGFGEPHRYIWQVAGAEVYDSLLGRYLPTPRWEVALRRYDGDVVERAEEWQVSVSGTGQPMRITHRLPEERAGESLEEAAARAIADSTLRAAYGIATDSMELVSAVPVERPARRDWTFTWAHPPHPLLGDGRLRVEVELAGTRVVRTGRFVQVPEEWQRTRRAAFLQRMLPGFFGAAIVGGLWLFGSIAGLVRWSRGTLSRDRTVLIGTAAMTCSLVMAWNNWPVTLSGFTTTEPYLFQRTVALVGMGLAAVLVGGSTGLLAGLPIRAPAGTRSARWLPGLALGASVLGVRSLVGLLDQGNAPVVPRAGPLDEAVPLLSPSLSALFGLLVTTGLVVAASWAWWASRESRGVRRALGYLLLLGLALLAAGSTSSEQGVVVVTSLAAGGAIVWWALHHVLPLSHTAPAVAALTIVAAGPVRDLAANPWPGSRAAAVLSLLVLGLAAVGLINLLERDTAGTPRSGAPAADLSGS